MSRQWQGAAHSASPRLSNWLADRGTNTSIRQPLIPKCAIIEIIMTNASRLEEEIADLPAHYHDTFSQDFILLLAALRLHGFFIQRADEVRSAMKPDEDLWPDLSHPSVWIYAPSAPVDALRKAAPDSVEHARLSNEIIRANLADQEWLLSLLSEFYATHSPTSFQARLILETVELGETCLRSQGASVRVILDDSRERAQWLKESQAEMRAFAAFLAEKL